jgi:hypothetical protein
MLRAKICHFLGTAASAILIFIFVHSLIFLPDASLPGVSF